MSSSIFCRIRSEDKSQSQFKISNLSSTREVIDIVQNKKLGMELSLQRTNFFNSLHCYFSNNIIMVTITTTIAITSITSKLKNSNNISDGLAGRAWFLLAIVGKLHLRVQEAKITWYLVVSRSQANRFALSRRSNCPVSIRNQPYRSSV